jgi:hypothetical protein
MMEGVFMKNRLKKISALFLLTVCGLPLAFSLFLLVKQQFIRHAMEEKLENQYLKNITNNAGEFQ